MDCFSWHDWIGMCPWYSGPIVTHLSSPPPLPQIWFVWIFVISTVYVSIVPATCQTTRNPTGKRKKFSKLIEKWQINRLYVQLRWSTSSATDVRNNFKKREGGRLYVYHICTCVLFVPSTAPDITDVRGEGASADFWRCGKKFHNQNKKKSITNNTHTHTR